MGIYIFTADTLIEYLEVDEADPNSSNDFGKNIIPNLLHNGEKLYAYNFEGYWRDVGTIASLWESNMDLIGDEPVLKMNDKSFRIYSRNMARPPQFLGENSSIVSSLVSEGCRIYGTVENSILSGGVIVEEGAIVKDSIIMDDVVVSKNAAVYTSIVDQETVISPGVTVGVCGAGKDSVTVIAKGSNVTADVAVSE